MLRVEKIRRKQGSFELEDISFDVKNGEFFVILGPSGAGKTTLLDCIAGFRQIDSGKIFLDEKDITNNPPEERNIGYIPQDPSLFPHFSAFRNIEYGLRFRNLTKEERKKRVLEIAMSMGISKILDQKPGKLSGGEKQRVALARALVIEPKAILMDEPLAHIDAPLRKDLRYEIRKILKSMAIPTVCVTHDQSEAFSIADTIAIMNNGRILEIGSPFNILDRPQDIFTAHFLGFENIFDGEIISSDDYISMVRTKDVVFRVPGEYKEKIKFGFRPEHVVIFKEKPKSSIQNIFEGKIVEIISEGSIVKLIIDIGIRIVALITRRSLEELNLRIGSEIFVGIKSTSIRILKNR